MRVRTLLRVVVWAALVGYVAFVIVAAVSNYFDMVALVEGAARKVVEAERWTLLRQPGVPVGAHAEEVRDAILRGAERSGLVIDDRKVVVSQAGETLRVSVSWSYPMVAVGGETIVGIPLALDRSFPLRP
jgi:hypothetical protein